MADTAWSWCPECQRWVPQKHMSYFEDGRMCYWCLEGLETPSNYVYEPNRERTQCLYCDSFNTVMLNEFEPGGCNSWRCRDCGEISYFLY